MEFATAVWDPYRQDQIDSIEAVQWRAARFIKRDYNRTSSVKEMLQSLDLDPLENRRRAHRLNIFYLAANNLLALSIYPIIFHLNNVLLDHLVMIHLFKPTAIMIIICKVFIQGQ